MKRVSIVVTALLCLLVAGYGHKIEDKDLVGTWAVDPTAVAGKDKNMAKVSYTLTPDHQYVMAGPVAVSVKGTWRYLDKKLTITPVTLMAPSPLEAGKVIEVPIGPAVTQFQAMSKDPALTDALKKMSETI